MLMRSRAAAPSSATSTACASPRGHAAAASASSGWSATTRIPIPGRCHVGVNGGGDGRETPRRLYWAVAAGERPAAEEEAITRVRTGLLPGLLLVIGACGGGDKSDRVVSLGGALEGDDQLFANQDTVEAEWQVVEPVPGDATPVYEDEPGTWGLQEADQLVSDGGWSNPAGRERRPR
jgi:hypothetical protein